MWRLLERRRQLAAETLLALLPTPILLFMGDEFHAPSSFPFFCDFVGELGRAVTAGRRKEFARLWPEIDGDAGPEPVTEAARLAAVLDWSAVDREPHRGALERARERLAIRRRELTPRLPARAAAGKLLRPATLVTHWTLADGATLRLAANLAATPYFAPPATPGRCLLATPAVRGDEWPPWYVEWTVVPE
jgi:maltooligosyltrehalose trehalohydrolase